MKITGSYDIDADRQKVWEALNDPEILKACIPGCESLEKSGENELTAEVTAKVGPVKAKFSGVVELKDLNPPTSYRIEGSGKGGAAGFAKGGADVRLSDIDGGGTNLEYEADAQVGGKLAQIGGRLIDGTAKKMADQFFENFRNQLASGVDPEPVLAEPEGTAGNEAAETADDAPVRIEVEGESDPMDAPEAARPEPGAEDKTPAGSVEEEKARAEAARKAEAAAAAGAGAIGAAPAAEKPASGTGIPAWVWFIGAVALIIVLVALVT
ncbi:MAG: SRPBCC family protein [Minwuia sp.]|uniref:SRPBCC family protein n=1 Tax=Minwuia sp. TaxID=2493630 RepID=UPI003A870018